MIDFGLAFVNEGNNIEAFGVYRSMTFTYADDIFLTETATDLNDATKRLQKTLSYVQGWCNK